MNISELAGILQCDDVTAQKFWTYHKKHPEILRKFCQLALRCGGRGFKRYGAKTIMENIRYEHDLERGPDDIFKVNNNFTAYYGSIFMFYYPAFKGLFEVRDRKGLSGSQGTRLLQQG